MNKVYFAVLALLVSASAMAQNRLANSSNENLRKFTRTEITPMIAPRGTFDPKDFVRDGNILDEDFEDETLGTVPTDWSTNEVEQLDGDGIGTGEFTDAFVVHDAETANNGTYWPVPFLGGNINNKFAGVNDDGPPCDCDNSFSWVESPEMDFTGASNVALTFDVFHDANFGGGDAIVEVSLDGGTSWTAVTDPLPIEETVWQSVVVPLYSYSGEGSVIIRFTWSDNSTWATGLAVDNVCVGALSDYNQTAAKIAIGDWSIEGLDPGLYPFSQVPTTQISPVSVTGIIANNGFNDNTNIGFEVDLYQNGTLEVDGEMSPTIDLESLTRDTLSISEFYTPNAETGTVEVELTAVGDNTDGNPGDDMASASFEITENIYARDNGSAQAFVDPETGSYFFGNLFDIYTDQTAWSIPFAVGAGTETGAVIQGVIFEFEGLDAEGLPIVNMIDQSTEYLVTGNELNGASEGNFTHMVFPEGVDLSANTTYLVGVQCFGVVRTPVSGTNVWVASWLDDGQSGWGATLSVPMVRINFDPEIISVEETAKADFSLEQNAPNPFAAQSRIDYKLGAPANVTFEVYDLTGKLVISESLGQQAAGAHEYTINGSELEAGMYQYTLIANGKRMTKKMLVK
jgi:hypothetical protein